MFKANVHLGLYEPITKPSLSFEMSFYQSTTRKIPERFNFQ